MAVRLDSVKSDKVKTSTGRRSNMSHRKSFGTLIGQRSYIVSRYDLFEGRFYESEVKADAIAETLNKKFEPSTPIKKSMSHMTFKAEDVDVSTPSISSFSDSLTNSSDIENRMSNDNLTGDFRKFQFARQASIMSTFSRPGSKDSTYISMFKDSQKQMNSSTNIRPSSMCMYRPSSTSIRSSTWSISSIGDRFAYLNPDFVRNAAEQRIDYEFVRNIAIKKLHKNIEAMVFELLHSSEGIEKALNMDEKFHVFGWTNDDLRTRRRRSVMVWIEIIPNMFDESHLELLKFAQDVDELQRLIEMLMDAFTGKSEMSVDEVVEYFEESFDYLKVYSSIELELKNNKAIVASLSRQLQEKIMKQELLDRSMKNSDLQCKFFDSSVLLPTEYRYRMGFLNVNEIQANMKLDNKVQELNEQINKFRQKIQREEYCMQCTLNAYYTEIEAIRENLNEHSYRFQEHWKTIENASNYVKHALDKIISRQSYLREEKERFREEIRQANECSEDNKKRATMLDEQLQNYLDTFMTRKHRSLTKIKPKKKNIPKIK